jgi:valyl-tRNA synthetase
MNLEAEEVPAPEAVRGDLELADRWILARLSATAAETTRRLEAYRLAEAAETVYHFFWGELADWYLELIKPRLYGEAPERSALAARATLVAVLDGVLRLLHPVMPFLTETLWRRLPPARGAEREPSLVVARWPEARPEWGDPEAEDALGALRTVWKAPGVTRKLVE